MDNKKFQLANKKFRKQKMKTLLVADSYQRLGQTKRAMRVRFCGSILQFTLKNGNTDRLIAANFCRDRLCPMCQWRKSIKIFSDVSRIMRCISTDSPTVKPLFLTLTIKNCPGADLKNTIKTLFDGWHRMVNTKWFKNNIVGSFRALEITYNVKMGEYHPHLHCILLVHEKYFYSAEYMTTRQWAELWQRSCRLIYMPSTFIRSVSKKNNNMYRLVAEIAKYTVKSSDFLFNDKKLTDDVIDTLQTGMKHKRLFAFGGIMKSVANELKINDKNINNINLTDEIRGDIAECIITYRWNMGIYQYVIDDDM
ncbi:MAG: protein rep [Spirochaetales bacterium]